MWTGCGLKENKAKEISWKNGWLDEGQVTNSANQLSNNSYGEYLRALVTKND